MPVFEWEQSISKWASQLPHDQFYQFIYFWSHPPKLTWLIIVCCLLTFLLIRGLTRLKNAAVILFTAMMAVGVSDLLARRVLKASVLRLRPEPFLLHQECLTSNCWGFVSSHAANVTAFAVVMILSDRRHLLWCIPVAILVCVSRVVVFEHFALDVIGGMVCGALVGWLMWRLTKRWH